MIAITDASAYLGVEYVGTNNAIIIPTQAEIQTLIGSNEFINTAITMAFKNLLIRISNESVTSGIYLQPAQVITRISQMFNTIGFYYNNGIINFQINTNALDSGTTMIINNLHQLEDYQDIAYNAFHNNSWAQEANNIRAMGNSGLQKLYYITVYSNSNFNNSLNFMADINNSENILNRRNESTQRFLMINLNQNADPVMPTVRIKNNSNVSIKLRVKVEHENYVSSVFRNDAFVTVGASAGAFGPAIPYDLNNNGVIQTNEYIYLNRRFIAYFPNQANAQDIEDTIYTVVIPPQQFWDVNFDDRIRGGEATIEFIPEPENVNFWSEGNHHHFKFHIRGKNPTYQQVLNYLNSQNYLNRFWFLIRKIRQETGSYNNFNGLDSSNNEYEFRHFDRRTSNASYNLRKNSRTGLPVFGPPRGFGLGQIDNFGTATAAQVPNPPPVGDTISVIIGGVATTVDHYRKKVASDQEVWNWKRNIDASIRVLEMKIQELDTSYANNTNLNLTALYNQINNWNIANPTNRVVSPGNQVEPPASEITNPQGERITFSFVETEITGLEDYNAIFNGATSSNQYEKSFLDACLMKSYNGYGTGTQRNYLYSTIGEGGKPQLNLLRSAVVGGQDYYYVREVCRRND